VSVRRNRSPDAVAYGVDLIALVRGASIAFAVLVAGGLVAPLVATALPLSPAQEPVAYTWWLTAVALGAFVFAGTRIGEATQPIVHGGAAALTAYLLVVPLMLIAGTATTGAAVLFGALVAVVVGGLAGLVAGRRRGPVAPSGVDPD